MSEGQKKQPVLDWVHLPADVVSDSLWVSLHDGDLTSLVTDHRARTTTFEFDVPYIWNFHGLPEETRFVLYFDGVTSLRASRSMPPAEGFIESAGESSESRNSRIREYHAKWRDESIAWSIWEAEFTRDTDYEVSNAQLAVNPSTASFYLIGYNGDSVFTEMYVRAERLKLSLKDSIDLSLNEFLEMGGKYWDAFGK